MQMSSDMICCYIFPMSRSKKHQYKIETFKSKTAMLNETFSQCMKFTEKFAFNIASEASCVYILSEQKFIKNAKNGHFGDFLKN